MLSTEKFDNLIDSLRQSLKHHQQENLGRPFDKTAQQAFGANNYAALAAFNTEFKAWLYNSTDQERLIAYVQDVYYPIANYGILFACLERDYERRIAGDGRSQLSADSYALAGAYQSAIAHTADRMRIDAAKYAKINVVLFQELMINSFTIDGRYISEATFTIDRHTELTPPAVQDKGPFTVDANAVKLTHPQIAILYHILGQPINENNAKDIAVQYGQTSGKKLAITYSELTSELFRTAKGRYTVKNYEAIMPLLKGKHKEQADRELNIAKRNNEKY